MDNSRYGFSVTYESFHVTPNIVYIQTKNIFLNIGRVIFLDFMLYFILEYWIHLKLWMWFKIDICTRIRNYLQSIYLRLMFDDTIYNRHKSFVCLCLYVHSYIYLYIFLFNYYVKNKKSKLRATRLHGWSCYLRIKGTERK